MVTRPEEVPIAAVPTGDADPLRFADRCVWTDRMLDALRKGGPEGGKWYWLHDKVFAARTLRAAYAQVARNDGAPGVDGVTVERFGARLDEEIARLLADWKADRYRPQAVKRTWIAKPGSTERRPLGIPTVRDRVVQAALRLVMEPIFERDFHPSSHGYRPGHKASDALSATLHGLHHGMTWVVDADLKGFFDSIPHGPLLKSVKHRITDRRILDLLQRFLQAGVMEYGVITEPESGSPQGGVISPLLANIYLNAFDHYMAERGWQMIRYADDWVILCTSQTAAEQALADAQEWISSAGLTLHPTKTSIVDMSHHGNAIEFLGYRLQRHRNRKGQARILRLVRAKSLAKLKDTIRLRTRRTHGHGLPEIIGSLNSVLRGWHAYFRSAHQSIHKRIDQTVRRRLRAILAKRRGTPNWGGGRGHNRWPNAFFADAGLFSLEEAHRRFIQSC